MIYVDDSTKRGRDTEMTKTSRFHYTSVENAMSALCCRFASGIGQPMTGVTKLGSRYGTIEDIATAISQPASVASVLGDLCDLMGIEPPEFVALALGECD